MSSGGNGGVAAVSNGVDGQGPGRRSLLRAGVLGGGAHFVAIGGYRERPVEYVHVEDPWYGPSDVPYSTLVNGYQGTGSWTHSYWTKP